MNITAIRLVFVRTNAGFVVMCKTLSVVTNTGFVVMCKILSVVVVFFECMYVNYTFLSYDSLLLVFIDRVLL